VRALLVVCSLFFSAWASAADRVYAELHGGFAGIQHSELSFRPLEAHVSIGAYVFEHIGIDLNLGGAFRDGDDDGFELTQKISAAEDSVAVNEDFQGGTFAIGLRRQIARSPLSVVGVYRVHSVDQPITIDSYSLGVRAAW